MNVYNSVMSIEGTGLDGDNPLPKFRSRQRHREVPENGSLSAEQKEKLGYETGDRYLPYRIQDRYTRDKKVMQLKTVILENDILQAVFLPEYGGRLYSLKDKRTDREVLYKNPVFQPANLAILNAWFSGGIEWNIGQLGHTFTTCAPLHAAKLADDEGNAFLRFYDYERCKNVFWQLDIHLPAGSEHLQVYVRIINDQAQSVPMYWWTNIAVDETEHSRVFASTSEVIYIDHAAKGFGSGEMPYLPTVPDADVSYPMNFPFANEYFFQSPEACRSPWEAVSYEDGRLVYERSTSLLRYRKMFCWGSHAGGRRWCDFLAKPGEGNYVEIQGGFAPTQLHGLDQPANTEWDFTQIFGVTDVDAAKAGGNDWAAARDYIEAQVEDKLHEDEVYRIHDKLQSLADRQPEQQLHTGSGWGALERRRREKAEGRTTPQGFVFADASLGAAQQPWLGLLETGSLPAAAVDDIPASWMVQEEWLELLQASLSAEAHASWDAYMHLGVMLYEKGQEDQAVEAWEHSLMLQPSAWVYRNLAEVMKHRGDMDAAFARLEQAYLVSGSFPDRAFAEEYLELLIRNGQYVKAWDVYESLPESFSASDRLQIIVGQAALHLNKLDFLEKLFATEFAVIREGELSIVDMWYQYNARKLAAAENRELSEELKAEAVKRFPPPQHIDFRMS
ncbi:DUF5107 domain-containing protein [Paenibacillus eucommiae]|uniref:DUF5107 domain-containing protein n=1 Tax=Paenibacillus eucommiae TaxID=1355755 RepID=A0ABS4IS99_9BACL|nr:DUF5107 domain-containing protein [Paenibacillus eucommiae]MBP1990447.1 hypothetical protein [Paenibacillus eucommiae]